MKVYISTNDPLNILNADYLRKLFYLFEQFPFVLLFLFQMSDV